MFYSAKEYRKRLLSSVILFLITFPAFLYWYYNKYNSEATDSADIQSRVVRVNKRQCIFEFQDGGSYSIHAEAEYGDIIFRLNDFASEMDSIYKPAFSDSLWLFKENGEKLGFKLERDY